MDNLSLSWTAALTSLGSGFGRCITPSTYSLHCHLVIWCMSHFVLASRDQESWLILVVTFLSSLLGPGDIIHIVSSSLKLHTPQGHLHTHRSLPAPNTEPGTEMELSKCLVNAWLNVGPQEMLWLWWQILREKVILVLQYLWQTIITVNIPCKILKSSFVGEWVWKSFSHVRLFAIPWTVACQAPPSMGFSTQEYWSGLPFPSPWEREQDKNF